MIYGLLGVFFLVPIMRQYVEPALIKSFGFLPQFRGPAYGVGVLTSSVVLAIMILPFIVSISREALMAVPREQREAALAVGATRWESTWQAVVPFARLGIIGSVFLALARALGETMAVTMVIGNDPRIQASLLAPGYSIAAVIANEFTEATADIHLSALVELGLVLFLLTIVINGLARLLILDHHRAKERRSHDLAKVRQHVHVRAHRRCAPWSPSPCCSSFSGYLVYHGGRSLNWDFFTKLPAPVGESGGGMANAIVGSGKLLLLTVLLGVPVGFIGGVYLAEFGGAAFSSVVRYTADLLNGVPSIVIGILAYALVVMRAKQFSTFAGGFALSLMVIPITLRSTEQFLRAVPQYPAGRRAGPGRKQVESRADGGHPSRHARHPDRDHPGRGPSGG